MAMREERKRGGGGIGLVQRWRRKDLDPIADAEGKTTKTGATFSTPLFILNKCR